MGKYETDEALEMFGALVADEAGALEARAGAARELLQELADVAAKVPCLSATRGPGGDVVIVRAGAHGAAVRTTRDGSISVARMFGPQILENSTREVPLLYDPAAKKLFGKGFEPDRAPVPGARRPRRDGLAAVVAAIVERLKVDAER